MAGVALAIALAGCRWHFETRVDASGVPDGPLDGAASDAPADGNPALCGNAIVNPGEECDDGGATAACSASCQLVDQGPGGTCAAPKMLVLASTASGHGAKATGNTAAASNGAQSSCTPANTLDESYALVVANPETLTIVATPTTGWDLALAVRDGALACNQSTTICCVNAVGAGAAESSACSVSTGTVHIVIDASAGNQSGPYTLSISAP